MSRKRLFIVFFLMIAGILLLIGYFLWESDSTDTAKKVAERGPSRSKAAKHSQAQVDETPSSVPDEISRSVGLILGDVMATDGNKVAQALVRCSLGRVPAEQSSSVTTDEKGYYEIDDLPFGDYGILAQSAQGVAITAVRLSTDRPWTRCDLVLMSGGKLAGKVVDESGAGVSKATIMPSAFDIDGPLEPTWQAVLTQSTTADGAFGWESLPVGKWQFMVKAEGFADTLSDSYATGRDDIRIVLGKGSRIHGRVTLMKKDTPVAKAPVVAESSWPSGPKIKAVTDSDGNYSMDFVAAGSYLVDIESPAISSVRGPIPTRVRPAEDIAVDIQVDHCGSVSGMVKDVQSQNGVQDMKVVARPGDAKTMRSRPISECLTDESGSYELTGLAPGTYSIRLRQSGRFTLVPLDKWMRQHIEVTVASGTSVSGVDFYVEQNLEIGGKVVDQNGNGVARAHVVAYTSMEFSCPPRNTDTETNDDGSFTLNGFSKTDAIWMNAQTPDADSGRLGPYSLSQEPGTGARMVYAPELIVLSATQMREIIITLNKGNLGLISGTVVDHNGRPMYAMIEATLESKKQYSFSDTACSNADGVFALQVPTPGIFDISLARHQGRRISGQFYPAGERIRLAEGQSRTGLRLVYPGSSGPSIRGHIADSNGVAIGSAYVQTFLGNTQVESAADSDGAYAIEGLEAGMYTLTANAKGFASATRGAVAAGSEGVDFVLAPGVKIEGNVQDARTKQPVTAFEMALAVSNRLARNPQEVASMWVANPDGYFTVDSSGGNWNILRFRARGYKPAEVERPDVGDNNSAPPLIIELQPGELAVEGTVVNESGQAVVNAVVYAANESDGRVQFAGTPGARSGDDGRFRLDSVPEDTTAILVSHPEYAPTSIAVTPHPGSVQDVRVVLSAGGIIQGVVRDGGQPVTGALISTVPRSPEQVFSDDTGQYRITGLAEGIIRVRVQYYLPDESGNRPPILESEAVVEPGAITEVNFDL